MDTAVTVPTGHPVDHVAVPTVNTQMLAVDLPRDALWCVMDPWLAQPPTPGVNLDDQNAHNHDMIKLIHHSMMSWQCEHRMICLDRHHRVHPRFESWPRVEHDLALAWCQGFQDVVIVGFHWGRCCHHRPAGAIAQLSEGRTPWLIRDLCGDIINQPPLTVPPVGNIIYSRDIGIEISADTPRSISPD